MKKEKRWLWQKLEFEYVTCYLFGRGDRPIGEWCEITIVWKDEKDKRIS